MVTRFSTFTLPKLEIAAAFVGVMMLSGCTGSSAEDFQANQEAYRNGDYYAQCPSDPIGTAPALGVYARVQRAEDDNAIRELRFKYSRAFDAVVANPGNVDEILNLFADDLCVDYGVFGRFYNKNGLRYLFQYVIPAFNAWSFHVASQPIINVNNGIGSGSWRGVVHAVARANYAAGPQPTFLRYNDRYQRTATGWKFRAITVHFEAPPTGP